MAYKILVIFMLLFTVAAALLTGICAEAEAEKGYAYSSATGTAGIITACSLIVTITLIILL